MDNSKLSRRHLLTASSLIPLGGFILTGGTDSRAQATSLSTHPTQVVTVTPTDAAILPNSNSIIPVTIIIEIYGGFSVFGNEIDAGNARFDLGLRDFSVEESDTDGSFLVDNDSPVTVSNDESVVAPSKHAVTLFLRATGNNPEIIVEDSEQGVDDNTPIEYDTDGEVGWGFFADMAGQRRNLFANYEEAYEGVVEGKAWEAQFAEETIDILSTLAVDKTKSIATANAAGLLDEDWINVVGAGYGLKDGLEGTAMGKAITSTFDLKYDFFDHTHQESIACAGRSDDVLNELKGLAADEQEAWSEENRTAVIDALEKQRKRLFDTSTGSESLYLESRAQRYYPTNLGRACDGIPFPVGPSDTEDEVRDFFEMLMEYAREEEQNLTDTLRFVTPPRTSVSTVQHHSEINPKLRQLATGDLEEVSVTFEVSNGATAGLTSQEGYLSISHSPKLTATIDNSVSDDVISDFKHEVGDDIIHSDGNKAPADYPLFDINGQYEPGETKRLIVDFEFDGDSIDVDEGDDGFEDIWFKYRSALQPFLTAANQNTEAGQDEFARAPAEGENDQQGFPAYEVSASDADDQYPPTAKITAPVRVEIGDSVTFDGSDSTTGGDIDSFSWEFDTDGDGLFDETRSGEVVSIAFDDPGTVTARLTVTDALAEDVTETDITIDGQPPLVASFDRRPSVPEPDDDIEFRSTTDADSFDWEIDGQHYSGESVSTSFEDPGEYEVHLEVSRGGESDEINSSFTVEGINDRLSRPRARVDVIGDLEASNEIVFDGASSYHPYDEQSIDGYEWIIDGESFEGDVVSYSFETDGSYSIELTVVTETNGDERSDSRTMTVDIDDSDSSGDNQDSPGDDPDSSISEIEDWHDLDTIREDFDGEYVLVRDLDAETDGYDEHVADQDGGWEPIGERGVLDADGFAGSFDGNGHEISDIVVDRPEEEFIGLFRRLKEEASVEGIVLTNMTMTGDSNIGGLAGRNRGVVKDSSTNGDVMGSSDAGGLIGRNRGVVKDSSASGDVAGRSRAGGLVGQNQNGEVRGSSASGDVTGRDGVGGLVGQNQNGEVRGSSASGDVTANLGNVGGLVGANRGSSTPEISESSASGDVTGRDNVGGLVGQNQYGVVSESWASGDVTADSNVGGLVGRFTSGSIENSHYNLDEVLINDERRLTIGGLLADQYQDWRTNEKQLELTDYDTLDEVDGRVEIDSPTAVRDALGFTQDPALEWRLTSNIDLSEEDLDLHLPYLAGTLNGDGHTLSVEIDQPAVFIIGPVGVVAENGAIEQLDTAGSVTGDGQVGGLVGQNRGTVTESSTSANVMGRERVGGLIGSNDGQLNESSAGGDVTGDEDVGGLAGWNGSGVVSESWASGDVTSTKDCGGLIGQNRSAVSESWASGDVTGTGSSSGGLIGRNLGEVAKSWASGDVASDTRVGGLVGSNQEKVTESWASGNVTGDESVGGLVGRNTRSAVCESWASGDVTGDKSVGGLVGRNNFDSAVSESWANGDVTADSSVGGLVGESDEGSTIIDAYWDTETTGYDNGVGGDEGAKNTAGLTTEEMQGAAAVENMAALDFDETWRVVTGPDAYPIFEWQDKAVDDSPPEPPAEWTDAGLTDEQFEAVDQAGDGSLSRDDIRNAIQEFVGDGTVDGVGFTRDEIRTAVQVFIRT